MKRQKHLFSFVWISGATLVLALAGLGCGSTSNTGTTSTTKSGSVSLPVPAAIAHPPAALTTAPKVKPKYITIRLWSGEYETVFQEIGRQFTKDTGVQIHWDTTDELVSYQKINQEESAGLRPEDDASMQAQQRAYIDAVRGQTLPISAKVAPNMLKAIPSIAQPGGTPSGATTWAYVNPYTVTTAFIVNPKKVNPASLTSWRDLASPRLRHSIVFDQTESSIGIPLANALGVDPAKNPPSSMNPVWAYVKKFRPNVAAIGNGTQVTTALTSGVASVAVTCTCNIIGAGPAAAKMVITEPKDGMGLVADGYYIHKGIPAANYYYAEVFANYLFSSEAQKDFTQAALVPDVPGTPVPAYMKANPKAFPLTAAEIKATAGVVYPFPLIARYDAQWQIAYENALK